MKVFNTRPMELYRVSFDRDWVGREIEDVKLDRSIQADIQANTNQLQITMYGDRAKNILTMFSNEDIDTEYLGISGENLCFSWRNEINNVSLPQKYKNT